MNTLTVIKFKLEEGNCSIARGNGQIHRNRICAFCDGEGGSVIFKGGWWCTAETTAVYGSALGVVV